MGSFEDWLAEMPVEDVRRRIADLERELEVMRVLERRHRLTAPSPSTSVPPPADSPLITPPPGGRGRRLSPERAAIVNVLRQHPDGMAPVEVARALGKETNPIQTNMSRMTKAGMIARVGTGRYRLPPTDLTEGTSAHNGTHRPDEPSGSEGEAMEP